MTCLLHWLRYGLLNGRSLRLGDQPFVICDRRPWESRTGNVKGINGSSGPREMSSSMNSFTNFSEVCFWLLTARLLLSSRWSRCGKWSMNRPEVCQELAGAQSVIAVLTPHSEAVMF
jgi:hypothetical protein